MPDDDLDNWEIEGISGLHINTDHSKDKGVYFLELDIIPRLFETVYRDTVVFYSEDRVTGNNKK